jgi:hypothetical protein
MRKLVVVALATAAAAATPSLSHATTLALDFGSLPSAQGWTYHHSTQPPYPDAAPPEGAAYSVDGSALSIDTIGYGVSFSEYVRAFPFDPTKPYSIAARARVTETEVTFSPGGEASGLFLGAVLPSESNGVSMNSTGIRVAGVGPVQPFDATVFHDFRIDVTPGVREDIFIDGGLFYSGAASGFGGDPILEFGNSTSFENIRAEITELVYSQATELPEPNALFAVLAAAPAAMMLRRRRR